MKTFRSGAILLSGCLLAFSSCARKPDSTILAPAPSPSPSPPFVLKDEWSGIVVHRSCDSKHSYPFDDHFVHLKNSDSETRNVHMKLEECKKSMWAEGKCVKIETETTITKQDDEKFSGSIKMPMGVTYLTCDQ